MSKVVLGLIAGLLFGTLDVLLMLPMSFSDKTTAYSVHSRVVWPSALFIGCVQLPSWPGWLVGLLFGVLISLPNAIIYSQIRSHSCFWGYWWSGHWRPDPRLEASHLIMRWSETPDRRTL